MIKIIPIATYCMYWLLLFMFLHDMKSFDALYWDNFTDYWCCAFLGYSIGVCIADWRKVDSISKSIFLTVGLLAMFDLVWYNTPIGTEAYISEYIAIYITILLCTFVFNEIFKKNEKNI